MPRIAYIDKTFRDDKLELVGIANGIAAEYEAQGYGPTLRRLCCRMVSRDIIPNDIRSCKNLGDLVDDARLAGLVDRRAVEDRTRDLRRRPHRDVRPGEKRPAAMRIALMAVIAQADGLAMLDGRERSEGAQLEARVARSLMMPVKTVGRWPHGSAGRGKRVPDEAHRPFQRNRGRERCAGTARLGACGVLRDGSVRVRRA